MIILLPAYIIALVIILAAGLSTLLVLKRSGLPMETNQPVTIYFIWGVISLSTVTATISLFTAISNSVLLTVAGTILVILTMYRNEIYQILSSKWKKVYHNPLPLCIFVVILVLVTISVNETLRPGDTGGYHAQAVRWLTDYGAVAGIGNIIPRVAFNNHLFVLASLFDAFWLKGQFHLLINGLFFLFGSMFLLQSAAELFKGEKLNVVNLLGLFIVIPLLWFKPSVLNTLYVEMSVTLLLIFLISRYLKNNFTQQSLILISALTGLLLSYKASLLPVALLLIPLLFTQKKNDYSIQKRVITVLSPFLIILIPFVARNIILSGYPLYPMPLAEYWPFIFDWQMPSEQLTYMINEIKSWARTTGDHTNYKVRGATTFAWILPWFKAVFLMFPVLFTAVLLSIPILLYKIYHEFNYDAKHITARVWVWSLPLISLAWWFFQVPNIRLGYPWIFLATGLALVVLIDLLIRTRLSEKLGAPRYVKLKQIIPGLIIAFFLFFLAKGSGIYTRTVGVESHLITQITPMPKAEVDTLTFNQGKLTVYLAGLCNYHKPPCTPEVGGNGVQFGIKQRGENLSTGFKATGFKVSFNASSSN